jgi:hypothetical protein
MKKSEKIEVIKRIIREFGETSTSTLEASSSPVVRSVAKDHFELAERFGLDDVDVIEYVHETEVNEYSVSYEDLEEDVICEIFRLMEEYEADMIKTNDRCKDENY